MKKLLYLPGIWMPLIMLFSVSCEQQPTTSESKADLTDVKNDMQEVIELIDESVNEESVHVFIHKTDLALNRLDNHIDEYLSVIDMSDERIEKEARNSIIKIKEKVAGIDVRLAMLDDEDLIGEGPFDEFPEQTRAIDRARPTVYPYPYPYPNISTPTTIELTDIEDTAIKDIEEYAKLVHQEIVNELKGLKTEIDEFIVAGF
jgi:hypothetical protein